jgi:hypothetical protein
MVKTETAKSEENYHRREILSDNATSKEYAKGRPVLSPAEMVLESL